MKQQRHFAREWAVRLGGGALALAALSVCAQTPTTESATDTASIRPVFFGYTGVYYGYDFNVPRTRARPPWVYSENRHNEVSINIALLGARFASERVRGTFAIQTGTYPDANYAAEPQVFKHIYEAYAGVRLRPRLWLDAGVFLSHIGLEGPISRDDFTLTRSMMADNSPYYEAGARLTYDAPNGHWTVVGLVLNGWQVIRDQNENMSTGWQVQWRPTDRLTFNSSTYAGEGYNLPDSVGRRLRYYHDLYVTYRPTARLTLAAAWDIGRQERPLGSAARTGTWHTGTAIVNWRFRPRLAVAARAEYMYDPRLAQIALPATAPTQRFSTGAASVGLDYFPVERAIVRVEAKGYRAQDAVFERRAGWSRSNAVLTGLLGLSF